MHAWFQRDKDAIVPACLDPGPPLNREAVLATGTVSRREACNQEVYAPRLSLHSPGSVKALPAALLWH